MEVGESDPEPGSAEYEAQTDAFMEAIADGNERVHSVEDTMHAYAVGYVSAFLVDQGVAVVPLLDTEQNISCEMLLTLPPMFDNAQPVEVRVRVIGMAE